MTIAWPLYPPLCTDQGIKLAVPDPAKERALEKQSQFLAEVDAHAEVTIRSVTRDLYSDIRSVLCHT